MFDLTLSFDNGPTPDVTPLVLDVLKRRGILSTFFVIGEKVARPENHALAERAHAEGHWIGNHTWSHSRPFGLMARDAANAEFDRTQAAIGPLVHAHRFFRPYGEGGNLDRRLFSRPVLDHLAEARATIVLWSALPHDWDDEDGWVERGLAQCTDDSWKLMVLHDIPKAAIKHLDRFIGLAQDRGGRIRRDFPPDCLPMVDGEMKFGIEGYITA